MPPRYRPAIAQDAAGMCRVLNQIIAVGGTTAHRTPFDEPRMRDHYIAPDNLVSCHVAVRGGQLLGFQALVWCGAGQREAVGLPPNAAYIATFVDVAGQGLGIGQGLFDQTCASAVAAGVSAIDATIRRENTGGLKFYSRLGFVDLSEDPERITKLYDLSAQA